jgi:hypothetical protein
MSEIVKQGSKYSEAKKMDCAIRYALCGNGRKVAKATGVSEQRISDWKKTEWWDEITRQVRNEKTDELRAKYQEAAIAALDHSMDKLPEASAHQAATISGIYFDKTRIIDGLPAAYTAVGENMKSLAREFQKLSGELAKDRNKKIVSEQ